MLTAGLTAYRLARATRAGARLDPADLRELLAAELIEPADLIELDAAEAAREAPRTDSPPHGRRARRDPAPRERLTARTAAGAPRIKGRVYVFGLATPSTARSATARPPGGRRP